MKQKSLLVFMLVAVCASFLMVGCSGSSEPEVDKNVPMGSNNDPFKPTSVTGAGGGTGSTAPEGAKLGTPSAQ